jgi:RES domain-containing protein
LKVTTWRIAKRKHAKSAFSGEGARLYGGRWNSPGIPVIYTAESQSLAALEILVHLDGPELLDKYLLFPVEIAQTMIQQLELLELPRNWRAEPAPERLRAIGDAWVESKASVALRVPSALVPGEHNFLLNPGHKNFAALKIGEPFSFSFDPRLSSKR